MKPLKVKVSITLDADLTDTIRALAEADDRTFSQYINLALKEHVAAQSAARNAAENFYSPKTQIPNLNLPLN